MYNINELCIGIKIIHGGEPCIIIDNECVKPGKGQSFNRVKLKKIVSGKVLEKTFKSGDYLESADILEINLFYLYCDREFYYFMDEKNFEQISISSQIIGSNVIWMIEKLHYLVTLWNEIPILVTPPDFLKLKVIKTEPVIKGSSNVVSSGTKIATVSTGAIVKVPVFIQLGELIKINTRTGSYISRAK